MAQKQIFMYYICGQLEFIVNEKCGCKIISLESKNICWTIFHYKKYTICLSAIIWNTQILKNMYSKKASYVQFSIQFMHLTKCLKHNHEGLSQNYQKGTNKRSLMTSFLYDDMYIPNNNKKNLSSFSQFVKDTKSFRHIMWQIFFCKLNGNDISNKGVWEFVLYWQNINLFIVKS